MSTDVFISYTRVDLDVADSLARALDAVSLRVWWDRRLLPGDDIDQVIHRVLAETTVVVAVLSPSSIASDWVMWELSQARRNGVCIVPILVRGVQPDRLPSSFDSNHALVLSSENGQASLGPIAKRVRDLVELQPATRERGTADPETRDARRRLAIAAAHTARQTSAAIAGSRVDGSDAASDLDPAPNRRDRVSAANYSTSDGLVSFLERHGIAIAFTSPQSGTLFMLGRSGGRSLTVHEGSFRHAMGLHRAGDILLLATRAHVYRLENSLSDGQGNEEVFTHCFVPMVSHPVGALDVHDVGMNREGDVVFVNTRGNCLAAVSRSQQVRPIWVPFFISEMTLGDRCHLNGLAMLDGAPAYVTAASRSDVFDGWRGQRSDGGIVMDVKRNAIVCEGLSMPHSPQVYAGTLWLLNSGSGELGFVEGADNGCGRFVPVARCPGYTRGLAFHGDYAIVGLSRPRYDDFSGFELEHHFEDARSESWCGIQIIETSTGRCVEWFRIDHRVAEIYGVAALPNVTRPRSVRPMSD